jgi:hypothetical protein
MVSSLPFLAPVFVRKAKEYRSKNGYGSSSGGENKIGRSGNGYKLSNMSRNKGTLPSTNGHNTSEEDILKDSPDNSIMKSITYTVEVDENGRESRRAVRAAP